MKNIDLKYLYPERYFDHHLVQVSKKVYNILIQKEILSEMSYSEIARLEDCSECAIRRSINRGINQLRSKVCGKL